MKISTKLFLGILLLFLLSLMGVLIVFLALGNMSDDGRVVNYAGIVRGASQRLVKLEAAGKPADALIGKLDRISSGLLNGDEELRLPKQDHSEFVAAMQRVNGAWTSLKAKIAATRQDPKLAESLIAESEAFFDLADQSVTQAEGLAKNHVADLKSLLILLMAAIAAVCGIVLLMTNRQIVRPLVGISNGIHALTAGDLTIKTEHSNGDEISRLAEDVEKLAGSFDDAIRGMIHTSNHVVDTLDRVRLKAQNTTLGARDLSDQSQRIAVTAEQMGHTITEIGRNATAAAETALQAMATAGRGKGIAENAVGTVNHVQSSAEELAAMISRLAERTNEIGSIVTVIKSIADQTNLLALNAAIEAARAGDSGRGFAVVADEVRKLAERTIGATSEISEKIAQVQDEAGRTATSMQAASGSVSQATRLIRDVGGALTTIVDAVQEVNDQITRIAASIDEQSAASEHVVGGIGKTSEVSTNMANMASETMHEVNGLIKAAETLRTTTIGFKVSGSEQLMFDVARTDHRLYVAKIAAHINGTIQLDPEKLPSHHECRFGKWYDTDGTQVCSTNSYFRAIQDPHQRIHELGKQAVVACDRGEKEHARRIYDEIEQVSASIADLLERAKGECVRFDAAGAPLRP